MNDGLTRSERDAIRALETRQSILATRKDTDLVRSLLHAEVQKIKAGAMLRLRVAA